MCERRGGVSVAGAGGVCWAGPTPQLSDRLKLTHNLRDMSVSENSQDYNLIQFTSESDDRTLSVLS